MAAQFYTADELTGETSLMTEEPFDVVILGGGNAGIGVTGPARRAGLSVAMIEARDLGGTCPNRGCTPKKILVAAGHALYEIERARVHHIAVATPKLDWAALIAREKTMVEDIPDNLARAMERRHVEVITGAAAFAGPDTICVGDRLLKARHIVIATGSKPRPLPISGAEHMITSDEVLSERGQPASVVFIGGGVISLEFGHVYARAGTEVTILEALPQLLPAMDKDAVAHLAAESERIGIRVKTGVNVQRVERAGGKLRVIFSHHGVEQVVEADRVVNGAGRVANIDTLDLAAGNVEHGIGRISVDRHLRSTSNPRVYVCGDAMPVSPQLSPIAIYEGEVVGRNIVDGPKHSTDYEGLATSVFTVPALLRSDSRKPPPGRRALSSTHMSTTCSAGSPRRPMPRRCPGQKSSSTAKAIVSSARISSGTRARSSSTSSHLRSSSASQRVSSVDMFTRTRPFLPISSTCSDTNEAA